MDSEQKSDVREAWAVGYMDAVVSWSVVCVVALIAVFCVGFLLGVVYGQEPVHSCGGAAE